MYYHITPNRDVGEKVGFEQPTLGSLTHCSSHSANLLKCYLSTILIKVYCSWHAAPVTGNLCAVTGRLTNGFLFYGQKSIFKKKLARNKRDKWLHSLLPEI